MSDSGKLNDSEWDDLVERHLRGELSEAEQERLAGSLDRDASLRKDFVQRATWDTELTEVIRAVGHPRPELEALLNGEDQSPQRRTNKVLRALLAVAAMAILALSVLLFKEKVESNVIANDGANVTFDPSVARISGLSGSLIWTGDCGEIVRDISIGTVLPGGTIEGMAPDSWFELRFNDSSTVMISGTSMLTFADRGQKILRLKEGVFSANVVPQPEGKPMLIHTPSTLLQVLGTQFDVEASQDSTRLTVTEGKVRVRRLSDRREVDVPAKHRVIAEGNGDLIPQSVPESVNHWTSQLHLRPGCYGKWLPATQQRVAALKAIPLVPPDNPSTTLYLLGIPVSRSDGPPVVVRSDSLFVVRGRLQEPAKVHFGIAVSDGNGEFAGKFRGDLADAQPVSKPDDNGQFEVVYRIGNFTLDPCVRDRKEELATMPHDLVLNCVWAFTNAGGSAGLEVTEVELIQPKKKGNR